jgi:D-ribose pyranose/furanose isomerase RbsD
MRKHVLILILILAAASIAAAQTPAPPDWKFKVAQAMPLLGHRNWILIVDSAYPLQVSPGIETIDTGADQLEVLEHTLHVIERSTHVRPVITMDAELPYVPEADAPGVTVYRRHVGDVLHEYEVESLPHDQIIASIAQTADKFHVLILKTNLTIPYTSVFIRLDCKYWSSDAEKRLRQSISAARPPAAH